ncbi:hypothetical protein KBD45_01095 [Candidatus Dojkabacteria bacterium]|nr:hypothetical protein [Candidatus Dojkabacteria bacterium]
MKKVRIFLSVISILLVVGVGIFAAVSNLSKDTYIDPENSNASASLPDKYTMFQRFGAAGDISVTANLGAQSFHNNGIGWYMTWSNGIRSWGGNGEINNTEWMPMVQHKEYEKPMAPESNSDPICLELINFVGNKRNSFPNGTSWIVGNEIGWDEGKSPEELAQEFVNWRNCIKSINTTYKLGSGAILPAHKLPRRTILDNQGNPITNFDQCASKEYIDAGENGIEMNSAKGKFKQYSGYEFFRKYIKTIRLLDPAGLPDFITFHPYAFCELPADTTPEESVANSVQRSKNIVTKFRTVMKDLEIQNLDLVANEVAYHADRPSDADHIAYMNAIIEFFVKQKDSEIGNPVDNNRLVQRWAWFLASDKIDYTKPYTETRDWRYTLLYDSGTKEYTNLGKHYMKLATNYINENKTQNCVIKGLKSKSIENARILIKDTFFSSNLNPYLIEVMGNRTYSVLIDTTQEQIFSTYCTNNVDCHTESNNSKINGIEHSEIFCPADGYIDLKWDGEITTPRIIDKQTIDLVIDSDININDFALFVSYYKNSNCKIDYNNNNNCKDIADFAIFIKEYKKYQ